MKLTQSFIQENKENFLNELLELLKIPSISADAKYKGDVSNAAEQVANYLTKAGADKIEICKTAGHPIVYGEKIIDPKNFIILLFNGDAKTLKAQENWKKL